MPRDGILTKRDIENIEIINFIFHIIPKGAEEPIFLDDVSLSNDQELFFKERLIDASAGTQYEFTGEEPSLVKKLCKEIQDNSIEKFLVNSKTLATEFLRLHIGNVNYGVFVVAHVTVENNYPLVFLLKIDHSKVYQYKLKKKEDITSAVLNEIKNTFIEEKKAMQKVAIVNYGERYKWDVIAMDKTLARGIRDYFQKFLQVKEREVASTLTPKCIALVKKWAIENKDDLDHEQEIADYKDRAVQYMINHDNFDSEDFYNTVVKDENIERKERLVAKLRDKFHESGIHGTNFIPTPGSMSTKDKVNIRKTAEGVKIEWTGSREAAMLDITQKDKTPDGLVHILIKTSNIEILE